MKCGRAVRGYLLFGLLAVMVVILLSAVASSLFPRNSETDNPGLIHVVEEVDAGAQDDKSAKQEQPQPVVWEGTM